MNRALWTLRSEVSAAIARYAADSWNEGDAAEVLRAAADQVSPQVTAIVDGECVACGHRLDVGKLPVEEAVPTITPETASFPSEVISPGGPSGRVVEGSAFAFPLGEAVQRAIDAEPMAAAESARVDVTVGGVQDVWLGAEPMFTPGAPAWPLPEERPASDCEVDPLDAMVIPRSKEAHGPQVCGDADCAEAQCASAREALPKTKARPSEGLRVTGSLSASVITHVERYLKEHGPSNIDQLTKWLTADYIVLPGIRPKVQLSGILYDSRKFAFGTAGWRLREQEEKR